jgi:queuine tRNA-ribosyltransferase
MEQSISKKKNGKLIFTIDEMGITFVDTEYTKAYLRLSSRYLGKQIATIYII